MSYTFAVNLAIHGQVCLYYTEKIGFFATIFAVCCDIPVPVTPLRYIAGASEYLLRRNSRCQSKETENREEIGEGLKNGKHNANKCFKSEGKIVGFPEKSQSGCGNPSRRSQTS